MKKYIKAYKVSGIVFVAGIPTVFGSFIGFGMAIGTTAHLVAHLIRSQKIRIVYYALTLVSSLLFA
ncbi:MAG: hypothetical protein LBC86_09295, partial [Oscillospiraceae bacterium]|nr:hypothetical protein [Oscillospiraceae bacterium]